MNNRINYSIIVAIIVVFILIGIIGSVSLKANDVSIYKILAFNILLVWLCIMLCYFIWAVKFYTINYGITDNEWDKIYNAKENRRTGKPYNPEDIAEEPKENPYKEESFGFPTGTVRGMLAFTLLFGAIALLIVSFDPELFENQHSFFIDQFEFFKTAFLMMIAFYFGTRSLKYLKDNQNKLLNNEDQNNDQNSDLNEDGDNNTDKKTNIGNTINPPVVKVTVDNETHNIPIISPIEDPMNLK